MRKCRGSVLLLVDSIICLKCVWVLLNIFHIIRRWRELFFFSSRTQFLFVFLIDTPPASWFISTIISLEPVIQTKICENNTEFEHISSIQTKMINWVLFVLEMKWSFVNSISLARLAQSAERKALNLVVVGSSPTVGEAFDQCRVSEAQLNFSYAKQINDWEMMNVYFRIGLENEFLYDVCVILQFRCVDSLSSVDRWLSLFAWHFD